MKGAKKLGYVFTGRTPHSVIIDAVSRCAWRTDCQTDAGCECLLYGSCKLPLGGPLVGSVQKAFAVWKRCLSLF